MKRLRSWIRNYFGFSTTETNGFLILLPLVTAFVLSEPVYQWWIVRYGRSDPREDARLDSVVATWNWKKKADPVLLEIHPPVAFDPNKISAVEFRNLGLSEKLSQRIIHFREKGGKFRMRADLKKIYGMDTAWVAKIHPYILLPERIVKPPVVAATSARRFVPKPAVPLFDLNLADTTQLMSIYGIGSKLSVRIVNYRTRLGGFISGDQLSEVYGLDTAVISRLKKRSFIAPDFEPRKIDLNHADKKELTSLPYIRFSLANAIAVWRFQHGPFKSTEDLKKIVLLEDAIFQKIKPYLTVKE